MLKAIQEEFDDQSFHKCWWQHHGWHQTQSQGRSGAQGGTQTPEVAI